jgi:periplasmic protein TonB
MSMHSVSVSSPWSRLGRGIATVAIAMAMTLGCFMVLPLLQAISAKEATDLDVRSVDTAALPPPPPPVEEEEKPPEEPDEPPPPELQDAAQPLDLAQLELALNPGLGGDGSGGDYAIKIQALGGAGGGNGGELFSLADLDQKPRAVYQQQPAVNAALRKKAPATVNILFVVDENGRVENPIVQSSSDPAFDAPALAAIKQWKFEPGKRAGKPVRFRMRQPMTFK